MTQPVAPMGNNRIGMEYMTEIYEVLGATVPYLQGLQRDCAWGMTGTAGGLAGQREQYMKLYDEIGELLKRIQEVFEEKPTTDSMDE